MNLDQIFREENTARLVARGKKLGYDIYRIAYTFDRMEISIANDRTWDYTPEIYFERGTGWVIQTTAYGMMSIEEIEKVTDGYQRAIAMVKELNSYNNGDLEELNA